MRAKFWSENPKGKVHSEDLDVGGMIIFEWFLGKRSGSCRMDASGSG